MKLSFLRSSLCILHFFLSLKLLDFSFNFIQKLVSFENIVLVEALLDVLKVAGDIFERVKEAHIMTTFIEDNARYHVADFVEEEETGEAAENSDEESDDEQLSKVVSFQLGQ
ncbi:hypothetical protein ACOSP7_004915 [Xanthoceras sorbifolium]